MSAGLHATDVRKLHHAGVAKAEIARWLGIGKISVVAFSAAPDVLKNKTGERIMSPQAEPEINPVIWTAIEQRRVLRFRYKNRERIVEPHDYGIHRGVIKLFGFQIGGSSSEPLPNWRWAEQDLMSELQLLDRTFPGGRPGDSVRHHKWDKLFIRVKPAGQK